MLRKSNRQYLENQQTVLSSSDSPCQTNLKIPEIHARQFWFFFCFLFTPDIIHDGRLRAGYASVTTRQGVERRKKTKNTLQYFEDQADYRLLLVSMQVSIIILILRAESPIIFYCIETNIDECSVNIYPPVCRHIIRLESLLAFVPSLWLCQSPSTDLLIFYAVCY